MALLVIDESGLPIFEYPQLVKEFESFDSDDDVLISGLLSAINSFGKKVLGDDVQHISFGSFHLSFSRDVLDCLYVYIFSHLPGDETLLQRFHLETMALFNRQIRPILCVEIAGNINKNHEKKQMVYKSIIDPFFRLWSKRFWKKR